MARRFEELDSLRGLAAVAVIFNHCLIVLPAIGNREDTSQLRWLMNSPIRLIWGGHEAVLFFFVLSGFVLSLPFFDRKVPYIPFMVKRICRIYIPYLAAVVLAFAARAAFSREGIDGLSTWFNGKWIDPITLRAFLLHCLLIESFKNGQFDPVLWSLVHEMRISIIFPLLMLLVNRTSWKVSLVVGGLISALGHFFTVYHTAGPLTGTDYLDTFRYIVMFVVGALMAKHRWLILAKHSELGKPVKYGLVIMACLIYTYPHWVATESKWLHISYIDDLMITVGVTIFITTGLAARSASKLLSSRPLVFTGRVSYSVYLFHAILLLTFVNLLYGIIPIWAIMALTFVCTFPVSALAFKCLEEPSISIGRQLASRISAKKKAA